MSRQTPAVILAVCFTVCFTAAVSLLTTPPASAQEGVADKPKIDNSSFGRGPLFSISVAGPKALRQAILPTNLGALLGGPELRPIWNFFKRNFRDLLEEEGQSDDAEEAWAKLEELLLSYGGRMQTEFHLSPRKDRRWFSPHVAGHLLLWSDGRTDMAALSKAFRRFLISTSGEQPNTEDLEGGRKCEYFGRPGRDGITLPIPYGKDKQHLVLFFGSSIDKAIYQGLERLSRSWEKRVAAHKKSRRPGQLATGFLDMKQMGTIMEHEFSRHPEQAKLARKFFGADTWDMARASIQTAGPSIQIEASADFLPGDRGFIGAVLPDIGKLPAVAFSVPKGTAQKPPAFVAAHLRADKFYDSFVELFGNIFRRNELKSLEEIKAEVNKELGFDFDKEFLAHVGTEVLSVLHLEEHVAESGDRPPDADGLCFALRVTNDAAMRKTWQKLTKLRELRPGEVEKYGNAELLPVRFLDRGEMFGLGKGYIYYAVGERGVMAMKKIIDQQAGKADTAENKPSLPKSIQRARRLAPPGWNAVGLLPTRFLKDELADDVLWEIWREIRYEFPRTVRDQVTRDHLRERAAKVAPILKKYRLDRLVLLGGWEAQIAGDGKQSRARLRLIW